MQNFEIMFDDLTPEAREQFLKFMGLEKPVDGNYDVIPIAIIPLPEE